jgi:hypothetical protein
MTQAASVAPAPAGGGATYAFTDDDFQIIANRAQADFGLYLTLAKKDLAYSRLTKRLRALGLADFRSYFRADDERHPLFPRRPPFSHLERAGAAAPDCSRT